ncbi:MAG: biotin--[acetyl-CoA-carboxylase] ligase [Solirubrobacteraceae bacterium]|nr:biotin--[acetyl-CoA-carboxylase] ligase [Solirubrobacteraceae bacterium]
MSAAPLGRPRLHLREVDSTNTRARELAAAGAPHGTLVTATAQTAGRGRQGRTWAAPPGRALIASLVLRDVPPLLPLAAAVAVAEVAAPGARVKWPNDVLVGDADPPAGKVAGILAEGRPQEGWAVLGIGLNVAVRPEDLPPDVRGRAGTLGLEPDAVEPTLDRLLRALERWLAAPDAEVLDALRARDALAGREVAWAGGRGVARGIDERGRLVVERADGTRAALDSGEVHLTR